MKIFKKIILLGTIIIGSTSIFTLNANAATGFEGYAIFRDGAFGGINWHAGMMDDRNMSYTSLPVVHTPGWFSGGAYTKFASWSEFMNNKNFKGVYRPNGSVTSSNRDLFKAMGRNIARQKIKYNVAYQVMYNTGTAGSWVDYNEISSMRCDGVVEYIYEWYGFKVYGGDRWDVTKNDYWNRDRHSGTAITPQSQVNYLTKVQSGLPR